MWDFNHLQRHMELTREELIERAKGYKLTSDFYREVCSRGEIVRRYKRHFLHNITSHMVRDRLLKKKWTDKNLIAEAKKYTYRTEFRDNSHAAYVTAVKKGKAFLDKCCRHMKSTLEVTTYWTKERVREEARKYSQKRKFKLGSPEAYTKSLKFGKKFHERNCLHMVIKRIQRTDEEIKQQLLKYKSFSEARLKNTKLMDTAAYRGKKFYQEVTKHFESKVIQQEKIFIKKSLVPKIKKAMKKTPIKI